jgi:4-hydroxybenzoate polyprenyltransferase
MNRLGKIGILLEMIKFQHTVFALPFALMSALVASDGRIGWRTLLWILVAMVGARSSAMTFNRIADRHIDAKNPRTAARAIPAGHVSMVEAWVFLLATTALFFLAAAMLNRLALLLSPMALAVIWGYSLTKRFTPWAHTVLGLSLAIAPVAAWVAVTGQIGFPSLWLAGAVICWVAGFDIIYALQDIEFDRAEGLYSLPSRWGPARALAFSSFLHVVSAACLVGFGIAAHLGAVYYAGCAASAALLAYEHALVHPDDFSRVNAAFFTINGVRCTMLICFDLRFPELYRQLRRIGVDCIFQSFYNAGSGLNVHTHIMRQTMQCHAASNRFWISMANTSGPRSPYPGCFIQPDGVIVKQLKLNKPGMMVNTVDMTMNFYDPSAPFRNAAINGALSNGPEVNDPRSKATDIL